MSGEESNITHQLFLSEDSPCDDAALAVNKFGRRVCYNVCAVLRGIDQLRAQCEGGALPECPIVDALSTMSAEA